MRHACGCKGPLLPPPLALLPAGGRSDMVRPHPVRILGNRARRGSVTWGSGGVATAPPFRLRSVALAHFLSLARAILNKSLPGRDASLQTRRGHSWGSGEGVCRRCRREGGRRGGGRAAGFRAAGGGGGQAAESAEGRQVGGRPGQTSPEREQGAEELVQEGARGSEPRPLPRGRQGCAAGDLQACRPPRSAFRTSRRPPSLLPSPTKFAAPSQLLI